MGDTGPDDEGDRHEWNTRNNEADFLAEGGGTRVPEGFTVALTCISCPEQWDIFYDGRQVGYLRCRHSRWSLEYPDCGGELLIREPWHPERGEYESNFDDERPAVFERVFRALVARVLDGP